MEIFPTKLSHMPKIYTEKFTVIAVIKEKREKQKIHTISVVAGILSTPIRLMFLNIWLTALDLLCKVVGS